MNEISQQLKHQSHIIDLEELESNEGSPEGTPQSGQSKQTKMRCKQYTYQQYDKVWRLVAQKFVTYGYCFRRFLVSIQKHPQLKPPSLNLYHSMIGSIATRVFRALQKFLMTECKKPHIGHLKHSEFTKIRAPITQCKKWLPLPDQQTIFKFVVREFGLRQKKVYISPAQAITLYQKLLESASEKHEISHVLLNRYNRRPRHHVRRNGLCLIGQDEQMDNPLTN